MLLVPNRSRLLQMEQFVEALGETICAAIFALFASASPAAFLYSLLLVGTAFIEADGEVSL